MCVLAPNVVNSYFFLIFWFYLVIGLFVNAFGTLVSTTSHLFTLGRYILHVSSHDNINKVDIINLKLHIKGAGRYKPLAFVTHILIVFKYCVSERLRTLIYPLPGKWKRLMTSTFMKAGPQEKWVYFTSGKQTGLHF